ncbi:MAG: CBS domain-containing protein [Deltaproteobacteria bacterium]|nr:MAG: CBS domain-containing protein [Deltaproteobacteria bacterium]TMQ18690.1 MAG: CBS domain-containing protein [Deltaproteobacteria bacterium]
MKAQDLMTHPAVTCHVNDSLSAAAQKMWDHDCGALPVVNDEGRVTGMITDRDICMAACIQGRRLDELLVNCAMGRHVVTVGLEQTIAQVAQLMAEHQIRRLPVVDEDDLPVGVISLNDLAIEAVQPGTQMTGGVSKVAHALAAICQHRMQTQEAA